MIGGIFVFWTFALYAQGSLLFKETFDDQLDVFQSGKWAFSKVEKYRNQPVSVKPSATAPEGFILDHGIELTQDMKHYGFGSSFDKPISLGKDPNLVIQYELKFEEPLNCGGAYIKLLRDASDLSALDSSTPYSIMFGPDKCGATNKVHLIFQHQNPISKKWEEKHFNETVPVRGDSNTHLYTLVLRQNQDFEILVDGKPAKSGNLLTHFNPPINPPFMIDDPTDTKPEDWIDEATIPDPNASKPEDWDESAPRKIPDPNAVKPASWLDDAPLKIPNPDVTKPEDWDDEEDGEWEAPVVDNPDCDTHGCGPWSPPLIANPAYKGKWIAPKIPNPQYKGVWKPRQIPNPDFFEDKTPLQSFAPITALAVEVWTTNGGIRFDNFAIGSVDAIHEFTRNTFAKKTIAERSKAKDEQAKHKAAEFNRIMETGNMMDKVKVIAQEGIDYLLNNPIILGATILAMLLPIFWSIFSGKDKTVDRNESDGHPQSSTLDDTNPAASTLASPPDSQEEKMATSE